MELTTEEEPISWDYSVPEGRFVATRRSHAPLAAVEDGAHEAVLVRLQVAQWYRASPIGQRSRVRVLPSGGQKRTHLEIRACT